MKLFPQPGLRRPRAPPSHIVKSSSRFDFDPFVQGLSHFYYAATLSPSVQIQSVLKEVETSTCMKHRMRRASMLIAYKEESNYIVLLSFYNILTFDLFQKCAADLGSSKDGRLAPCSNTLRSKWEPKVETEHTPLPVITQAHVTVTMHIQTFLAINNDHTTHKHAANRSLCFEIRSLPHHVVTLKSRELLSVATLCWPQLTNRPHP